MKTLLRRGLKVAVVVILLGVVTVAALSLVARRYVSPEALVKLAEEQINSRVDIGEVRVSVFRLPATIRMRDVSLSPRSAEVDKPVGERAAVVDAPVRLKEVRMKVDLGALLKRRVEILEFVFEEPHLAVTLQEDGENSLDELLRAPGPKKVKRPVPADGVAGGQEQDDELLNTRSLNVYAHGFLATVEGVRLENGTAAVTVEKSGMVFNVRDLDMKLDQIDVDPAALEATNRARLHIAGHLEVDDDDEVRYGELILSGVAAARVFDPATGDLRPDLLAGLKVWEGSYLNTEIPVIQKGWGLVQNLRKLGLKIGELPERAEFGRGQEVEAHYLDERITLRTPLSVEFKDWELAILADSWFQTEEGVHEARAQLLASGELTDRFQRQLGEKLRKVPEDIRVAVVDEIGETWFHDGRLGVPAGSSGELSSPKVDLMDNIPDLGEVIKQAGKSLVEDKLPGLLDRLLDRDR